LVDAETEKKYQHGQQEIGDQRHQNEKNVRGQMGNYYSTDEIDVRCKPGSEKSGHPSATLTVFNRRSLYSPVSSTKNAVC
jgi:hypothetical protein